MLTAGAFKRGLNAEKKQKLGECERDFSGGYGAVRHLVIVISCLDSYK